MSWVTVKVPWAPEPLACMRRSGITSRAKGASFSISHTSCNSAGPRGPAVWMLRLSVTGVPDAWDTGGRSDSLLIELLLRLRVHRVETVIAPPLDGRLRVSSATLDAFVENGPNDQPPLLLHSP